MAEVDPPGNVEKHWRHSRELRPGRGHIDLMARALGRHSDAEALGYHSCPRATSIDHYWCLKPALGRLDPSCLSTLSQEASNLTVLVKRDATPDQSHSVGADQLGRQNIAVGRAVGRCQDVVGVHKRKEAFDLARLNQLDIEPK